MNAAFTAASELSEVAAINRSLAVHGEGVDVDVPVADIRYGTGYDNAFWNGESMLYPRTCEDLSGERLAEEEAAINRSLRVHGEAVDLDDLVPLHRTVVGHLPLFAHLLRHDMFADVEGLGDEVTAAVNRALRPHGEAIGDGVVEGNDHELPEVGPWNRSLEIHGESIDM